MSKTAISGREGFRVHAEGLAFLEGPRWHKGALYFSDFFTHQVLRVNPDGGCVTLCEVPGQPSGLGFLPDDRLLIASMNDRRLLVRGDDGALHEHADLSQLAPAAINDMVVDAAGRAYVGNIGSDLEAGAPIAPTRLILVEPDGTARWVGDDVVFPNGAVITPAGELVVAETFAARISAFWIAPEGELVDRRTWVDFDPRPADFEMTTARASGAVLPDGLALDADGALWVADAEGQGALRVADGGAVLDVVELDGLVVYAVALGDPDRRRLYMCVGPPLSVYDPRRERKAQLVSCRVDVPGAGIP